MSKENDGQYKDFVPCDKCEKRKDETIKREILGKSLAIQRLSLIRRKRRIAEIRERDDYYSEDWDDLNE